MTLRFSVARILLPMLPVMVAGLLATWGAWRLAADSDHAAARQRHEVQVGDAVTRVRARLAAYEHLLRSGAGLYAASADVSREEWARFTGAMRFVEDFTGVQGFGVLAAVAPQDVATHVAEQRRAGLADYTLRTDRELRPLHAPIVYIEPRAVENLRRTGEDQFADPVRRAALERSRDTGLPTLTARLVLRDDARRTVNGTMLVLPLYADGAPADSVADRRTALRGWVFCLFRMDELTEALFGAEVPDMRVELYDGAQVRPDALLHAVRADAMPADYTPAFDSRHPIEVAGITWTMRFTTLPSFDAGAAASRARVVLYAGVGMTLLMALLVAALSSTRSNALALAERMSRAHRDAEARTRAVLDHTAETILTIDADGIVLSVNPAGEQLFGHPAAGIVGQPMQMLVPEHLREVTDRQLQQLARADAGSVASFRHELMALHSSGAEIPVRLSVSMVQLEGRRQFIVMVTDISEQKRHAEQMKYMAHHDALTTLPNRTLFNDRAEQAIALAARSHAHVGILLIDLDRFKPINDTYGHLAGDVVLQSVASRLKDALRASDTVARIGGDEFVVVLPMLNDPSGADEVASKLAAALAPPMRVGAHELTVGASIGVAVYPRDGADVQTLLRVADAAMYARKTAARDADRNDAQPLMIA